MKISFDFDGTLTQTKYQNLATKFIENGCEVIIVTSRHEKEKDEVLDLGHRLGIETIHFTNYQDKVPFLLDCDMHFDDDETVIIDLNIHQGKCVGVLVSNRNLPIF